MWSDDHKNRCPYFSTTSDARTFGACSFTVHDACRRPAASTVATQLARQCVPTAGAGRLNGRARGAALTSATCNVRRTRDREEPTDDSKQAPPLFPLDDFFSLGHCSLSAVTSLSRPRHCNPSAPAPAPTVPIECGRKDGSESTDNDLRDLSTQLRKSKSAVMWTSRCDGFAWRVFAGASACRELICLHSVRLDGCELGCGCPSLADLAILSNEQKSAKGNFPGPCPVVWFPEDSSSDAEVDVHYLWHARVRGRTLPTPTPRRTY